MEIKTTFNIGDKVWIITCLHTKHGIPTYITKRNKITAINFYYTSGIPKESYIVNGYNTSEVFEIKREAELVREKRNLKSIRNHAKHINHMFYQYKRTKTKVNKMLANLTTK